MNNPSRPGRKKQIEDAVRLPTIAVSGAMHERMLAEVERLRARGEEGASLAGVVRRALVAWLNRPVR